VADTIENFYLCFTRNYIHQSDPTMSDLLTQNAFAHVMASKTDDALRNVILQKDKYEFEACIAAFDELERRNLTTPELLDQRAALIESAKLKEQQTASDQETIPASRSALDMFRVNASYFFTPLLVFANVGVFIIMVILGVHPMDPSVESLIAWGGNLRGLTLNGELWRLFTSTFLHGGLIHLLFNMFALLQVGSILEPNIGKTRFIVSYIATGIIASISSIVFNDDIVSVGASGAIFGIDGLLLTLLITKRLNIPEEARKSFLTSTVVFIGYNLMLGFSKSGIDNAAHIGGLLSGLLIGFAYYPSLKRSENSNAVLACITVFVLLAAGLSPQYIKNQVGEYQTVIETFSRNEQQAMWMYREPAASVDKFDEQYKNRLQTEGIDLWNENLRLLNSLTDMPDYLQQRIDLLKRYCQLRIETCQAMKEYGENNEAQEKVNNAESEIASIIQKLEELNAE
jgi:rhomboid protease GluP